jgi:predicted Zn finger-like uncharacterized protein
MSLITQCPNCATAFRVTPLDLRAHGGDVRCGRCAHVFNGYSMLATLRELEPARPAPPEAEQTARGISAVAAEMGKPDHVPEPALRQASGVESGSPLTQPAGSSVAQTVAEEAQHGVPPAPVASSSIPATGEQSAEELPVEELRAGEAPSGEPEAAAVPDESSIDRKVGGKEPVWRIQETDAQQRAFTAGNGREEPVLRTPEAATQDQEEFSEESYTPRAYASDKAEIRQNAIAWTFAWALGSLILLFFLAAQAVYLYRAELAVMAPVAKPYLARYCELLDCTIRLPQRTKLLNIETSDMQPDTQRPGVITLSATVRNHASYPQAFPLFQLTLIDAKDRPLASRTFLPETYLGHKVEPTDAIAPNNEINISLHLDSGDLNAAGYRLSLLYPGS